MQERWLSKRNHQPTTTETRSTTVVDTQSNQNLTVEDNEENNTV